MYGEKEKKDGKMKGGRKRRIVKGSAYEGKEKGKKLRKKVGGKEEEDWKR